MGSKKKQTRQLQKARFEQLLARRINTLAEKGIERQRIAKDKVVQHLQAEINRTARALGAINAKEKVIEEAKLQKQKNAEKVKEGKAKSKKQKGEAVPEKKGKKEKKQKK